MYRILLVEPHVDTAQTTALLLHCWGYEVQVAADGPSALKLATAFRPHLALLEIRLPGGDGYEVARRLRTIDGLGQLTLVALTCHGTQLFRQRSQEEGFEAHLLKPVEPEFLCEFLARLARIVRPFPREEQMRPPTRSASDVLSQLFWARARIPALSPAM